MKPTARIFFLVNAIAVVPGISQCTTGTDQDSFDMYLPHNAKTITVPPIPQTVSLYDYAGDKALVSVPAKCYEKYQAKLGYTPNWNDRQPGGPQGMFYFRVSNPEIEYPLLEEMGQSGSCACGLVLLMHGTGGVVWQSGSYGAMMSGMGYIVIHLDSHAMPPSMGLKGAGTLLATDAISTTNYCGKLNVYDDPCGDWTKPFCYSSNVENILNDGAKYREYMERDYQIRKLELDAFVVKRKALLQAFDKVFLLGRSEGAAMVGRYYNADLFSKLSGVIISGWSCDFNYFVSCAKRAEVCEDKCEKTLPFLNVNGQDDQYFGNNSASIASQVAANLTHGYGGPLTGNCAANFKAQGYTKGTVVQLDNTGHDLMYKNDNALRSIFGDFLADPQSDSSQWASLNREGCNLVGGVYECDAMSDGIEPCVKYVTNPASPYIYKGKVPPCSGAAKQTCGDVKDLYKKNECCGNPSKEWIGR